MDLRSLKYFVAVYEELSISAAAKVCFVAQPSISSSIKQLEDTLNTSLFERHARGVKATQAGIALYPLATKLLCEADAIKSVFQADRALPFRLGLIRALGVERMSDLLKEFTASMDGVQLTLVSPEDDVDARIITKAYLRNNEIFQPMWHDTYLLAIPSGHPLCLKKDIALIDFSSLSMVLREPCEAWELLSQALNESDISINRRANIQSIEYAIGLVQAGVGCALVPKLESIKSVKDVVFKPLKDLQLQRTIGLAYNKQLSPSPALESLKSICQQQQKRQVFQMR